MRGVFPPIACAFLPKAGGHSWAEVEIDDEWKPIDSYINDRAFHEAARRRLSVSGKTLGYSVSFLNGKSSCAFSFGEKGFSQMGAVLEDHGTWEGFSQYLASDRYASMNALQLMFYPVTARLSN
jgi:hypothetical protein